jgi:hypothetical protein
MRSKINNLEELLAEKEKVKAQIRLVEGELTSSARHTRTLLKEFMERKFSFTNQISQLFEGGAKQVAEGSAIGLVGRAVGMGSLWTGVLSFLAPVLMNFVRGQFQRLKEKKNAPPDAAASKTPAKPKKRNIFKRKKASAETDLPAAE